MEIVVESALKKRSKITNYISIGVIASGLDIMVEVSASVTLVCTQRKPFELSG